MKNEKRCSHCNGIIRRLSEATTYKGCLIHKQCIQLSFTYPIRCQVTRAIIIEEVVDVNRIMECGGKGIVWN